VPHPNAVHLLYSKGQQSATRLDGKTCCRPACGGHLGFDVIKRLLTLTIDILVQFQTQGGGAVHLEDLLRSGEEGPGDGVNYPSPAFLTRRPFDGVSKAANHSA
jgi:hypothetical protein